ncbi:MAG: hypothetical protein HYW57_07125 [Ignavibacteriales bacterium]|nr:hypothetical protein [Ignavibacteriales bacterium]
MNLHTAATERISITFESDSFRIREIRNLQTGSILSAGGTQAFLVRTPLELFEPTILTRLRRVSPIVGGFRITLTDDSRKYLLDLSITPSQDGLKFHASLKAPKPVWLLEWKLGGLRLDEVIVPALGGQVLTRQMPVDAALSYKYPFWWNAQFVLGTAERGGLWIRTKDDGPNFKLLRVKRQKETFEITYGFEANAPIRSRTLEAEWFVDAYEGSWTGPVDIHRRWMEEAFGLVPVTQNPHVPSWAKDINFVLEMWGVTKERPEPLHTFDAMIERLDAWKQLHDPRKTLVYLPGFAMHGIDSQAPDYFPSKLLGGDGGFRKLVKKAHSDGYRVMIHTNVLAMTFTHRHYPKFRKHQVVDLFGRPQGWGLDMDGDWLAEPYFAYINPGAKQWGDLMQKVIGNLIRKYRIDGVFLDQTLLAFNVSRGPNFLAGMRSHILRLQKAFPRILFAGEGLHEQVVSALPLAQIHGIDSIAEVHAMDGAVPWRQAHPVSVRLFGQYTRFVAHLLTKHPSHPMFRLQEEAYGRLGVVPALCLYNNEQQMDMPETRAMLRRANELATGEKP